MFKLTKLQKRKIDEIGKNYRLRFIILHGSYAVGKQQEDSDIDIALAGERMIHPNAFFDIYAELADVFGDQKARELDVKALHRVDPFFRYLVTRDGILLYGNTTEYEEFKAFTFRDFMDTADLRRLELQMTLQKQKLLDQRYLSAA
mgnify:CR=1 FL=1